ncbi:hypothetical protein HK103_005133 [Boothiomyces macroporosus]|uniref:Glutathione peroxidase n=1 Tax=Boothiomyces macroporosus TaxID=261099 RepID=A0AAD5Y2X4_9FUNG|nr:hypothetical protein HK103_005133 [Boothiomyces macroporosus]
MTVAETIYQFPLKQLNGKDYDMSKLEGKVVLIVNTASKCGFTPQLAGLEELNKQYADKGLVVLGFPCNQFAGQEPLEGDEIQQVCKRNYGVSFQIMEKIEVNGDNQAPIYEYLKRTKPGILGLKRVKWNFEKFLVNREGVVVERFASTTEPKSIIPYIEKLL